MDKAIITVVGKDQVGIIGRVCTFLADRKVNILDISQTIVQGYFNMMMIVDISALDIPFGQLADEPVHLVEQLAGLCDVLLCVAGSALKDD